MSRRGRRAAASVAEWALGRTARLLRARQLPPPLLVRLDGAASRFDATARALHRSRSASRPNAGTELEVRRLARHRAEQAIRVDQPLVLVSQVHRSGGTLLQRLLDGHPQLRVIPHELGPLIPSGPVPAAPDAAWKLLYDGKLPGRFRRGIKQARAELNRDEQTVPFLLLPSLHRLVFDAVVRAAPPTGSREMLDAYVTAYFNAWLECASLRLEDPRWVVGFEPEAIAAPQRMQAFHDHYPDGRVISVVREPAGWFVSARRWSPRFARLDAALDLWARSTRAALSLAEAAPGRVLLVDFEDLVARVPETTARIADFLGIRHAETLHLPTVNGTPVRANSSFPAPPPGVFDAPARRSAELSEDMLAAVERLAGDLYRRVRSGG